MSGTCYGQAGSWTPDDYYPEYPKYYGGPRDKKEEELEKAAMEKFEKELEEERTQFQNMLYAD